MTREELFYKNILDNLYDGVYFVDTERRITYWNSSAERITGYKKPDIEGSLCDDNILQHIDKEGTKLCLEGCPLLKSIDGCLAAEDEIFLHHKDGHRVPIYVKVTPLRNEKGEVTGAVEIFNESSEKIEVEKRIKELEKKIKLDDLTGIPRRAYMEHLIKNKLSEFGATGTTFGILFMDIDHFKAVNDTFGHDAGDLVLKTISNTLKKNIRPSDMVARWGGEEFVGLFTDLNSGNLEMIAKKMIALVRNSEIMFSDGFLMTKTISIGATLVKTGDTLEGIVKRADELMYKSKNSGRNMVTLG